MTKLHPIKHDLPGTLWCGPAALSITTGQPTSVIHRHIIAKTGKRRVKGVTNLVLGHVANALGFKLELIYNWTEDHRYEMQWGIPRRIQNPVPTLARFLREQRENLSSAPVIVNVTRHYVVVQGRTFIDNQVGKPIPAKKAPGRRRRVFRAWRVVPLTSV